MCVFVCVVIALLQYKVFVTLDICYCVCVCVCVVCSCAVVSCVTAVCPQVSFPIIFQLTQLKPLS